MNGVSSSFSFLSIPFLPFPFLSFPPLPFPPCRPKRGNPTREPRRADSAGGHGDKVAGGDILLGRVMTTAALVGVGVWIFF